jgi:galactokinase
MAARGDEMTGKRRFVGRAPGRLDLMGGAGNYSGGLALEATTAEAAWATVELRDDAKVVFLNPQMKDIGWEEEVAFSLADLAGDERVRELVNASQGIRWTAYVLGAFFLLKEWFPDRVLRGANVYIKSEIPMRKGAGSSAALEVAALKTAAYAYGVELGGVELAAACQWVESIIAGSTCGIVDQIAVVAGDRRCLLPLVCQHCLPQPLVPLPDDLEFWGVDSGGHSGGVEREAARVAAFMGYKLICDWEGLTVAPDEHSQMPRWVDPRWNGYLANVQPSLFRSNYEPRLPESLTGAEYLQPGQSHVDPFTDVRPEVPYRVRACARFAVEENFRTRQFVELLRAGTSYELMGELMYQSHYAYTECGLGCEAADRVVSLVCEEGAASGLYGARISGAGAGGAVVILGRKGSEGALLRVVERFAQMHGVSPYVFGGSSVGADRFGVLTLDE